VCDNPSYADSACPVGALAPYPNWPLTAPLSKPPGQPLRHVPCRGSAERRRCGFGLLAHRDGHSRPHLLPLLALAGPQLLALHHLWGARNTPRLINTRLSFRHPNSNVNSIPGDPNQCSQRTQARLSPARTWCPSWACRPPLLMRMPARRGLASHRQQNAHQLNPRRCTISLDAPEGGGHHAPDSISSLAAPIGTLRESPACPWGWGADPGCGSW
jgi:hypothetical protein